MKPKFCRVILPRTAGLNRSGEDGSKPQIDSLAGAASTNKFSAKKTVVDGIAFDSKKEARRWSELRLLERAGQIRNLRRQVVILLEGRDGPILSRTGKQMRLTVDFAYEDSRAGWAVVHEDTKGVATRDYEVRRGVAQAMGYRITET